MKLFVKDGVVVAYHSDDQHIDSSVYGTGVSMLSYSGSFSDLKKVGSPPDYGIPDDRPFAAPKSTDPNVK